MSSTLSSTVSSAWSIKVSSTLFDILLNRFQGASWMFYLPPKQKEFSLWGTCSNHCLEAAGLEDKITVFAGMAHGHRHLKDLTLSKVTKNREGEVTAVEEVFREENYDRMYQGKSVDFEANSSRTMKLFFGWCLKLGKAWHT